MPISDMDHIHLDQAGINKIVLYQTNPNQTGSN